MIQRLLRTLLPKSTCDTKENRDTVVFREEMQRHRSTAIRETSRMRGESWDPAIVIKQIRPWWEESPNGDS